MPPLPSLARRERDDAHGALISAFESETASVIARTTPRFEHVTIYVIVAMILLLVGLMSVVKLDRVVTSAGRIVPTQGTLFVQALDKAIVKNIQVKVGDVVKKGQILATLDPTFAGADLAQLQQKMASDKAEVARLEAEQSGKPYLSQEAGDPYQLLQASIWRQRQAEYEASMNDFDARIRSDESDVKRLQQDIESYSRRQQLAAEIEKMHTTLAASGYGTKLNMAIAKDSRVEMERQLAEAKNQAAEGGHNIEALKAQRAAYIEKWHSDSATELVTARNDLDQAQRDLTKAQKLSDLITLTAPEDAVVLKLADASIGSITQDNQPLITLVPLKGPVEAEVEIDASDIGFVEPGDPVQIKLDAYNFLQHGTAQGVIKTISEGSFTIGENQQLRDPYFRARIVFDKVDLRDVPADFRLIPGMTLTGDVMVGKRTILSYLVNGALRTGSEAMREP
jgi:hemolysin D